MDERAEEQRELQELAKEDADDEREQKAARLYWATEDGLEWAEFVSAETERWSK